MDADNRQPDQPAVEPAIHRHRVINSLGSVVAVIIGLISVTTLSGRFAALSLFGLVLVAVFFYSQWRVNKMQSPKVWNTIGTIIASLFVVGGLLVTGFFIFLVLAFSSWGGGGFGGGSGK